MKYSKNVIGTVLLACLLITVSQAEELCTETYPCGACPYTLQPVCGSTGFGQRKSYDNCCEAKCDNATVLSEGECKEEGGEKLCLCSLEYKPQCGVDAVTYPNPCVAECKGVKIAFEGSCGEISEPPQPKTCSCTREYNPHCGSDGKTYANPCLLICAKVKPVGFGPCREQPLD